MKFLVIDDDKYIYSLLKKQIKKYWEDSVVEHYNPAEDGIPDCDFKWSIFDIILLDYDIGLSNFNGVDILKRLSGMDNYPVVIMITGEGDENIAVKAIRAGADDYLIKYDIITDRFYEVINEAKELRSKSKIIPPRNIQPGIHKPVSGKNKVNLEINVPGYNILDIISNNISLTLYAIRDTDKKPVAIKLQKIKAGGINSNSIKRFQQEMKLLAGLDHPNVIKIIDHGITDDFIYYSMEYIEHGDMGKLLVKGPVPRDIAKIYFLQILNGVKALHTINIIHRDIKAKNILFKDKNNLVIADLGSAKNLSDVTDITIHGEVIGTPYYMSPEQFNGRNIDLRSDIYSLGVLFYEMLVGEKPYKGENVMEIVYKQSYDKPARLPKSLAKYQDIIDTMLEIDKQHRFQNIDEVINAIEKIY